MAKKKDNIEELSNEITIQPRSISDYLNKEYLNYCYSVIEERALPSVIDGFKPGARKVMHASLSGTTKDGKLYKLLALSGDTMRMSLYGHGDASLNGIIVGLAQTHKDNLNPLESDSQVGSLRDPDACGAPRYLYIKHSKYMDLIYKTDYDLLDFQFEEGQYVEPYNYLPIIPTLLCKNNVGVAVGYSMRSQSYNPVNLIDACLDVLKDGEVKTQIRPYVRGIKSKNWKYENDAWMNYGEWEFFEDKDVMVVKDLPADTSYEQFEKLLNKLEDQMYIKDWKNRSKDGNIEYEIIFPKKTLSAMLDTDPDGEKIVAKLKLVKQVPEDLLWVLDENHKLRHFNSRVDVVKYFVKYRLTKYNDRKNRLVGILEKKYDENSKLVKFIELVCKGKLKIRNRSKVDIKADMDKENLPIVLMQTPMSKVTIEERDELLKQNEEIRRELEYIRSTTIEQMYINDLIELRKKIEKDFI